MEDRRSEDTLVLDAVASTACKEEGSPRSEAYEDKSFLAPIEIIMQNKRLLLIVLAVPVLLLIPYIAMRYTNEVNWTPMDFTVMGAMLLFTGLAIEFALRTVRINWMRVAAVVVILFGFLMVWGTLVHLGG